MTTQQASLRQALEARNWKVVEAHGVVLDWWANQVWLIQPDNSQTQEIFLTFVVDPQWEGPRDQGQSVWAVTASRDEPKQWSDVTLNLGKGWQQQLPQFLSDLMQKFQ